jgi:type III secretion protein C
MGWMRRWALFVLFGYGALALAAPPPWGGGNYAYYAQKSPLAKVLSDFSNNFGVRLNLGNGVTGLVNGRIAGASPTEFLDLLTSAYGLKWFYADGTLYVVSAIDWRTQSVPVSPATMPGLKQALNDLRIIDDRFGWAELPEQGLLLISGPRDYVTLITDTIRSLDLAPSGARFAVFRLRYASVADRNLTLRDRQVVIPGVASVLRSLIEGSDRTAAPGVLASANGANGASANGGMSSLTSVSDSSGKAGGGAKSAGKALLDADRRSSIQADSRLNAIVIRDAPEMIPVYEKLIATLDVPTQLVEIEAMIVDINKTRLKELGIDWTAAGGVLAAKVGDVAATPTTGSSIVAVSLGADKSGSNVLRSGVAGLLARIRLLENLGDAKIIGKPMILTTDNSAAVIDLSQTFYTAVTGERVANLVPVTTGVMLKVIPHVVAKADGTNEIQLEVDIEDGTLINRVGLALPVVQRSTISTQAIIQERQSLLLGGFDSQEQTDTTQRVPLFGSLPVVGGLFRSSSSTTNQRERLFMITPRVVASNIFNPAGELPPRGNDGLSVLRNVDAPTLGSRDTPTSLRSSASIANVEVYSVPENALVISPERPNANESSVETIAKAVRKPKSLLIGAGTHNSTTVEESLLLKSATSLQVKP